jgi:DNA-binding GntR family transcriptional regulator
VSSCAGSVQPGPRLDHLPGRGRTAGSPLALSRTPVREAFLRLEVEGLLRLFPKRAALVVAVSPLEVAYVLEARALFDGHAVTKLHRAAPAERAAAAVRLREELDVQRRLFASGDVIGFEEADRRFHTVLAESSHRHILVEFQGSLRDCQLRMVLGSGLCLGPADGEAVLPRHEAIVEALDQDRAVAARVVC